MSIETDNDFQRLRELSVPTKRAAYSDRMAWMMALLSKIVYERFDEESDDGQPTGKNDNEALKDALAVGGFSLAGGTPVHIPETSTQAMVVVREAIHTEQPFAVLCFRGSQQAYDWMINFKVIKTPIFNPKTHKDPIGKMHKGYHEAFKSAEGEIRKRLELDEVKNLPLYITGHSLGGALATVATWYLSSKTLAASYTFGAPMVGDAGLRGWFKTPIYRIVNAADLVPFLPLKLSLCFRHYGDMKYLPFAIPVGGKYPNDFRIQSSISNPTRLFRWLPQLFRYIWMLFVKLCTGGKLGGPVSAKLLLHHSRNQYCAKLRAVAVNRNA